jgi:diguanylate cyclase
MSGTHDKQVYASPSEIAREALRRLALSRVAPTPENYRKLYHEISGSSIGPNPGSVLEDLIIDLRKYFPDSSQALNDLEKSVMQANWVQSSQILHDIISRASRQAVMTGKSASPVSSATLTAALDLLVQTLRLGVEPRLEHIPQLSTDLNKVIDGIRQTNNAASLEKAGAALKKIWLSLELQHSGDVNQQEALRNLLQLLLQNIGELVDEDSWLRGQLEMVSKAVEGPINVDALQEAEKRLKEVIFKQGLIKHSLREATSTLKDTMKTFINRMGEAVESTGDYQEKITGYAEQIGGTEDVHELNHILENVLKDTRSMQATTRRTHEAMVTDRKAVEQAEKRIQELEAELVEMSALVSEDPMTHSLNRRGMEQEYARETSRAMRHGTPLCVAMIDLDNFKKLNDTHGHQAGDEALIHLVRVAKEELRATDIIGRMGGEEFMIMLPNTNQEDALMVVSRLQRALTKKIFLNNNDRILITFSAGVAVYEAGESQASIMDRADKALYEAKHAGKNRVCIAGPGAAPGPSRAASAGI